MYESSKATPEVLRRSITALQKMHLATCTERDNYLKNPATQCHDGKMLAYFIDRTSALSWAIAILEATEKTLLKAREEREEG